MLIVGIGLLIFLAGLSLGSAWVAALRRHRAINTMSLSSGGLVDLVSRRMQDQWYEVDMKTKRSMDRILNLYKEHGVDSSAFNGVNGYGHGDIGREKFDSVVANLMSAEAALVRLQLFSGTHAISTALFGALRPGQSILGVSGKPYDTLEEVIGLRPSTTSSSGTNRGSLADWGINYDQVDLLYGNRSIASVGAGSSEVAFDIGAIDAKLAADPSIKVVHIQRYRVSTVAQNTHSFTVPQRTMVAMCDRRMMYTTLFCRSCRLSVPHRCVIL